MLLLDEPFSNLDTTLRVKVRTDVHRLLADTAITALFVTHDQEEAFVLGDVVAVVNDGVVEQVGTPADLYRRPASPWVAGFVGDANLLPGRATGAEADTVVGAVPLDAPVDGAGRRARPPRARAHHAGRRGDGHPGRVLRPRQRDPRRDERAASRCGCARCSRRCSAATRCPSSYDGPPTATRRA